MLIELPRWLSWKSTQPKSVVGIPPDAANFSLERKTSSGELIWSSRNHDYDPRHKHPGLHRDTPT